MTPNEPIRFMLDTNIADQTLDDDHLRPAVAAKLDIPVSPTKAGLATHNTAKHHCVYG